MNPLIKQIIIGWARAALISLSAILVQHHIVTASQGEGLSAMLLDQFINSLPGLVALASSAWQKYRSRQKLLVALMPGPKTEDEVIAHIAAGLPVPSVLTPSNTVPGVPDKPA